MQARVISYNLATLQATEDALNEWLEGAGEIRIDRCVTLGNAGPERDCGGLVIFYEELDNNANESDKGQLENSTPCRQCKKRPALKGIKTCSECREYQRQYREKQREEKKKSRYP